MFEIVYDDDDDDGRRTTDDGRRLDWYTISSPCEPNGSGELKSKVGRWVSVKCIFFFGGGYKRAV